MGIRTDVFVCELLHFFGGVPLAEFLEQLLVVALEFYDFFALVADLLLDLL